jgi:hypothetical protein
VDVAQVPRQRYTSLAAQDDEEAAEAQDERQGPRPGDAALHDREFEKSAPDRRHVEQDQGARDLCQQQALGVKREGAADEQAGHGLTQAGGPAAGRPPEGQRHEEQGRGRELAEGGPAGGQAHLLEAAQRQPEEPPQGGGENDDQDRAMAGVDHARGASLKIR